MDEKQDVNASGDVAPIVVWVSVVVLLILNVTAVVAFEAFRPQHLSYDGLWNARTATWAALLPFDNLLALGWYSYLTRRIAIQASRQAAAAERQMVVTEKQLVLAEKESRDLARTLASEQASGVHVLG